ncbi:MFS transporter [Novosphingobium subterraneum]|uniref:Hexuronate transporter n=1 Tax=Novosphingobium subterraneum TaxID=48936 RepID=A0A0B8ZPA9_9SPHN|nr:MFS transporter [Novosphingobium subterraneum]KHS44958.1 hexuronate transporter [Novosphingobium subterraneum]
MNWKSARLRILVLVMVGTILNYIARNSLGALAPQLKLDLQITTEQYSYIVGAFQLAYTIMQPIGGMLIDRIGLTAGFALFAVAWSVANMAHGFARGWLSLAAFRGLLGMAEAAVIPAGMKTIGEWFPDRERSVATGWFNAGTALGAVIAPVMAALLAKHYGWQAAFVVTGGIGLIFAVAWYRWYRSPQDATYVSAEELAEIQEGQRPVPVSATTIRSIVGSWRYWAIAVPRFLAEPAWQTFSFWVPLYFAKERGWDLTQIALFAWVPFLAADAGGILGGYLAPWLQRWKGLSLEGSRIAGIWIGAVLMIAPGCVGLVASPYAAIGLLAIGGFAHQVISVLINTLSADVFPKSDIAKANGLVGMAGWTGGLLFSLAIGQFADKIGFAPLFACLGLFDLIGAIWLLALRRRLAFAKA